ncbi:hypothetical protein LMG28614_00248 [Paraburkholderia ultramafica]|uniref:Uncharacterized protein n=1 Tax=Paraburkholderia ultramafica TaxID=1544867 RepID=A0A6S7AXY5_9BURK|nr:hypothetical protein [Paraburkholderia ultramafica]CAB3776607.1 hypothetical protein LMG28614_00248 [Paraburkholderia ultramafica]
MVERWVGRRVARVAAALSQRVYTLQPARPLALRVAVWAVACVLSAVLGAAALIVWHAQRAGMVQSQCNAEPVDEGKQQTELARARLALAEESAARAAVQKTANSAAADVARLTAELQFLRGQSKTRPAAPRR